MVEKILQIKAEPELDSFKKWFSLENDQILGRRRSNGVYRVELRCRSRRRFQSVLPPIIKGT